MVLPNQPVMSPGFDQVDTANRNIIECVAELRHAVALACDILALLGDGVLQRLQCRGVCFSSQR